MEGSTELVLTFCILSPIDVFRDLDPGLAGPFLTVGENFPILLAVVELRPPGVSLDV